LNRILYLLSFIFLVTGVYFYVNHDVEKDINFSKEEANIVSKSMLPMLVEESGIKIIYENPIIDFSNNNALIDLNFKVEGFSLIFSGNAKFNSKLTIKDNKIYFSELNYKSFNLIDKVEENELSDVFIKKYSEFIKNKTMEGLTITLKRKPIYYFNNDNNFINDFKLNESHLVINTSIYNKDYKTYYIICFIFSFLLLLISFLFNNNKTKRIRNE
tara:strand:- start:7356 stop:8000 length:645 start_codon:yes stop_codon:yes gene_type:complete